MREYRLPWPPSVNRYWRHVGSRVLISREGRAFRENVRALLGGGRYPPLAGRIAATIDAFPPDRRRRDLDNIQKATLDALEKAGVYEDDSQIDLLLTRRRPVVKRGELIVSIYDLPIRRCIHCGQTMPEGIEI